MRYYLFLTEDYGKALPYLHAARRVGRRRGARLAAAGVRLRGPVHRQPAPGPSRRPRPKRPPTHARDDGPAPPHRRRRCTACCSPLCPLWAPESKRLIHFDSRVCHAHGSAWACPLAKACATPALPRDRPGLRYQRATGRATLPWLAEGFSGVRQNSGQYAPSTRQNAPKLARTGQNRPSQKTDRIGERTYSF